MIATKRILVDLLNPTLPPCVYAARGDAYSRAVAVVMVQGRKDWPFPDGAGVVVSYRKPDGTTGVYDTLPDGTQAWSAAGNILTIQLAPQVLTCAGSVIAQVEIYQESASISTFPLRVMVVDEVLPWSDSEDYVNIRARFLPNVKGAELGQTLVVAEVDELGRVTKLTAAAAGADGEDSVGIASIKQTTTSTEDDGNNVFTVALTDGTTAAFTVKNGSKGSTGATGEKGEKGEKGDKGDKGEKGDTGAPGMNGTNGKAGADGKTPVVGEDYFTEADKTEIINAVIAALGGQPVSGYVDADNNIVISADLADGTYTLKYENADGTYTEIGTFDVGEVGPAYTNLFDPASATLNQRWSDSSYGYKAQNGYVVSDYIPVSAISTDINNPTKLRFRGGKWADQATVIYFNSSKAIVASATASTDGTGTRVSTESVQTDENGDTYIRLGYKNGSVDSKWQSGVAFIRVCLQVNSAGTAITASDIQNIIITIDEPIVD